MNKILSFLVENKKTVISFFIVAIIGDVMFFKTSSDYFTFGILAIYLFLIKIFNLKSKVTFLFCLMLLGIMFLYYLFTGPSIPTEKAAVWLMLFLIVGIIQQWRE